MSATVCEPSMITSAQASMNKEQKALAESLKDKSKRVRKLAKQITKVPADKKVALALEMKQMIAAIDSENDRLVRLVMRMVEEGYEDADSGSSSDEETQERVLAAADGGVAQLLNFQKGQVTVCTGKACMRKGGSEQILSDLSSRWQDNPKIDVQQCSCMGKCKFAANVSLQLRGETTTTVVTGLQPELLSEQPAKLCELSLV